VELFVLIVEIYQNAIALKMNMNKQNRKIKKNKSDLIQLRTKLNLIKYLRN
jgi:hypothetical protein